MKKKYIFLFFGFLFFNMVIAQVDEVEEEQYEEEEPEVKLKKSVLFGFNFQLGIPQGNFGKNVGYVSWGFGGNLMWNFKRFPNLKGGIDLGFQNSDTESRIYTVGFNEDIQIQTKNSLALGHIQLRFYPKINFFIRPYFEGMIGAKGLFTRTTETDLSNNDTFNSQYDNWDIAMSVGGAVGFEIPIQKENLFIEGRVAFLKGTSADYFARLEGNPNYINPIDAFELKTSTTDLLVPQIGIKFLIGFAADEEEDYEDEYYEDEDY